jgi:cytochrome bd-type quinol oxidase subunit 1
VLPTFLSASSITVGQVGFSLAGFVVFYTVLAVVEVLLMLKYIRLGPDGGESAADSAALTPGPSRYSSRQPAK